MVHPIPIHVVTKDGNSDIQVWETSDRDTIRREVLRKLNAAKGGGYIFQSDHSVSSQEAVELYRALARQNPDAFQPDLAVSLGMFGRTLEANERWEEAFASFAACLAKMRSGRRLCSRPGTVSGLSMLWHLTLRWRSLRSMSTCRYSLCTREFTSSI